MGNIESPERVIKQNVEQEVEPDRDFFEKKLAATHLSPKQMGRLEQALESVGMDVEQVKNWTSDSSILADAKMKDCMKDLSDIIRDIVFEMPDDYRGLISDMEAKQRAVNKKTQEFYRKYFND
jgi:hypothetical protein